MPAFRDRLSTDRRLAVAAAALIALGVLVRAVNHDEGQYVAAIALMAHGLPYRDFAYLQTPLQPLLLSPLSHLAPGWLLLATRAANGVFGFATIVLLYVGLRRFASRRARLLSCAALACTDSFLLATSLARNDALPMALSTAAVVLLLRGLECKSARTFALAGLAFGLAASAKISAGVPATAAALFLLLHTRRAGPRPLAALVAGGLIGLVPIVVMATLAPAEFRFDVFTYNVAAPVQWWTSVGAAGDLSVFHRLAKLVGFAALGAIIPALLAAALDRRRSDDRLALDMMIAGGLVAAFLPVPFFTQYLVPLLPPVFARLAIAVDSLAARWSKPVLVLAAAGCFAGLVNSFGVRFSPFEVLGAPAIAGEAEALANGGPVVTLSPERVAGRGIALDTRFATGPFLFRTRGEIGRLAEQNGNSIPIDRLDRDLSQRPPSLILAGGETAPWPGYPDGLDGPLVRWALKNRYRPVSLGSRFTAFVTARPRASGR